MLQSLLVYSFIAFILVGGGWVAQETEKLAILNGQKTSFLKLEIFIPFIVFALIFGSRYGVGVDHLDYLEKYLNPDYSFKRPSELLFNGISMFMSSTGIHFSVYFALWAFIQIFFLFLAFKESQFLFPYIAFTLIFGSYYLSFMNIIRQGIAISIFVYALQFIHKGKFLKYYFWIAIAFLFHMSALVLIVIYPIFRLKEDYFKNIYFQIMLLFFALFLHLNQEIIIQPIGILVEKFMGFSGYNNYSMRLILSDKNTLSQFGRNTGFGIFIMLFRYITIILYSKKLKLFFDSPYFTIIYNLFFLGILAKLLVGDMLILARPFTYLYIFELITASYFLYFCFNYSKAAWYKLLGISFILIYFVLFLNIVSNGSVNTSEFWFFWQKM